MYSIEQVKRMQGDENFFLQEGDKYCLVSLIGRDLTTRDVENQSNFCVLQVVDAYKKGYLSDKKFNQILNKIDLFNYSMDLLGPEKTIYKLNKEVIEEELYVPHFNSLCVICDDIYDSF